MLRSIIVSILTILMTVSLASASDIRRVVTGLDASNRSTATLDSQVDLKDIQPDLGLGYLWVTHEFPIDISKSDTKEDVSGISPPANGTQFGVVEFQPVTRPIRRHRSGIARGQLITWWLFQARSI